MKNDLLLFKSKLIELGLCEEYKEKWNKAQTKEDLMNMALDANGVELLADAHSFGYGVSTKFWLTAFGEFINGKWKRTKSGYTSCLYVDYIGEINQECTITTILSSKVEFIIPKNHVCKLYVGGNSEVNIKGEGECRVYSYGDNKITGKYKLMTNILQSEWLK